MAVHLAVLLPPDFDEEGHIVSFRLCSRVLLLGGLLLPTACQTPPPRTTGVIGMTLGGAHTCATVFDNGMRCWGDNQAGQLGNARNADSAAPVEPPPFGSGPSGT